MSFEDFAATCSRTFAQTPIRLIRMSSSLTMFAGCLEQPYRHPVLLCQPHFTDSSVSVAFFLNGTAYFEHLNEEKMRQRLRLLNNPKKTSFHCGDLEPVFNRIKSVVSIDSIKNENPDNQLHAKLLSPRLLSIEIFQDNSNFKFKFRCEERAELFEQHYVRQLLIQVKELSQRQKYLCELLEHKDELPQFDSKLFLSTPMMMIEDPEEQDEDDEILSSSTTGRLWKAAFGRRGGHKFLDICLLKKAYMKALEGLTDPEPEPATTTTSTMNTAVNRTIADDQEQSQNGYDNDDDDGDDDDNDNDNDNEEDDEDLVARIGKRYMESEPKRGNDSREMKRRKNSPAST